VYGVWNWRGRDEGGAIRRLPDWEEIPVNRDVYVVFDSDVMVKRSVQKALERIGRWLEMKGAKVHYVYLEATEDDQKQGVDDVLADGGTLDDLIDQAVDAVRGLPEVVVSGHQPATPQQTSSTRSLRPTTLRRSSSGDRRWRGSVRTGVRTGPS
jgi:hypothetical protein